MSVTTGAAAYLVVRREDGYGDVFPLLAGQRHTLGRANTNRIVLRDDLCSREHAEVFQQDGKWFLHDLNSLNGTRLNGTPLTADKELQINDEVGLGRSQLVFVEALAQLPSLPVAPPPTTDGQLNIKKRLRQTRFLSPLPSEKTPGSRTPAAAQQPAAHNLDEELTQLYRLALAMGSAATYQELVGVVLDGLLEAIPADVGAILTVKEAGRDLEVAAHRQRDPAVKTYHKVSQFVSTEVLSSREAILAEDVSRDQLLRNRESLTDLGATSLICAPVAFNTDMLGLIHLYCTDPLRSLDAEDLEFAVAVAKQLAGAIHQLKKQATLSAQNRSLRDQLKVESELVGGSGAMKGIESQIGRVAATNATVLIRGESGAGKELVARAIHYSSPRKEGPFVCLNCAALTETLLESELFGHEKGAFTGATERMVGKFEAANHGTIFLDEIGEMNLGTQAKLLRVLEGHPFERVGGHTPIRVDVRVVSATNKPLEQGLHEGTFRKDLFFRLQVVEIRVPSLRERIDDVPLLAEHFLKRFVRETGRKIRGFTPAALQKMQQYHWPGNVRELRNVVERGVALGTGTIIDSGDVWLSSPDLENPATNHVRPSYEPLSMEEIEKRHILATLEHTDWNKSQAAAILNIERSTLDRKIKLYDLKK
ncbi:ornithine decarboxylase [Planctomycetaceae bacterium SCGC AG-212-F19]|nr:ornithine decarboxylase [Planctomycetaceae bacterium SCGC AG-212-F19]